jgi:hypothetical protein
MKPFFPQYPIIRMLILLTGCMTLMLPLRAQEISKEVYVIKPYEPTLSDASKINSMPSLENIETAIPTFNYRITPTPIETSFEITPIKPAKLVSTALPKIYNSFIKVGMGNYVTPMLEFNISNLHSKDYAAGAYLFHKSSYSSLVLDNEDKVPAGYAVSRINLYGKKFFDDLALTGNLTLDHQGFNYYGYNTRIEYDTLPAMEHDDIHQRIIDLGAKIGAHSTYTDSAHLNYNADVRYNYLTDLSGDNENIFRINTSFSKLISGFMGSFGFDINYFKPDTRFDSIGNTQVIFSPAISKKSKDWRFMVGFEGVYDKTELSRFYIHPKGLLEFTVIEKIMIPFIGIGGSLETNHYQKIVNENHFITPGLKVNNTNYKFTAFGGIKGSIIPELAFRADVSFSSADNMYFFVNDTTAVYPNTSDTIQHTFAVEYDDIDLIKYHGQLKFQTPEKWDVTADFNYYQYSTLKVLKPWHKPLYDLTLDAAYRLKEKFLISGGFVLLGQRYAKTSKTIDTEGYTELKPVLDIDLGIKYLYSKSFTLFFDIYNLTNRTYLIWNQYPSQRFNFMIGFSYML